MRAAALVTCRRPRGRRTAAGCACRIRPRFRPRFRPRHLPASRLGLRGPPRLPLSLPLPGRLRRTIGRPPARWLVRLAGAPRGLARRLRRGFIHDRIGLALLDLERAGDARRRRLRGILADGNQDRPRSAGWRDAKTGRDYAPARPTGASRRRRISPFGRPRTTMLQPDRRHRLPVARSSPIPARLHRATRRGRHARADKLWR